MAQFPASSTPSALAIIGVAVLIPLTLAGWSLACAVLWVCDCLWLPRPTSAPPVPDVDTLTEYGWAQPPTQRR
jgi:hypothetical protein